MHAMWKRLLNKDVKLILKNGDGVVVRHGHILDANPSFVVSRDRFNRIHFVATSEVVRISEVKEGMEVKAQDKPKVKV